MEPSPATLNIAPNQISNTISLANESHDSMFIRRFGFSPLNINAGSPASEIRMRVEIPLGCNSPMDQWRLCARYTYDNNNVLALGLATPILEHLFTQVQLFCQGTIVKNVHDFTQTSRLSNRLSFSSTHNTRFNHYSNAAIPSPIDDDGPISIEESLPVMAPFTLNTQECVAPPGTAWDFTYTMDGSLANVVLKCLEGKVNADATGAVAAVLFNDLYFEVPFYRMTADLEQSYALKFIEPNLFTQAITSTPFNVDQDIGVCTPTMIGCFMQTTLLNSLSHVNAANLYKIPASRFLSEAADYKTLIPHETKGVPDSGCINTLQFYVGTHAVPQHLIDLSYGHRKLYDTVMNFTYKAANGDHLGESYDEWLTYNGPIIAFPVVLSEEQQISRIAARLTFKTAIPPTTNLFLFIMKQRIMRIDYDTSTGMVESVEISP